MANILKNDWKDLLEDEFKDKVKSSTDKAELKEYILKIMKEDN